MWPQLMTMLVIGLPYKTFDTTALNYKCNVKQIYQFNIKIKQ
jgi:hypothetical protein